MALLRGSGERKLLRALANGTSTRKPRGKAPRKTTRRTIMTDNIPDQIDPVKDCAEALLYADPETAGEKLRTAIVFESARLNAHQERQGRPSC